MNHEFNLFTCCKYNSTNCNNCLFKQIKVFKNSKYHGHLKKQQKAGIIYFNKKYNKMVVIQSRGNLWGIPKGTCNENESLEECAVREFFEETGIKIKKTELIGLKTVKIGTCTYFCLEKDFTFSFHNFELTCENNDVSGIGYVNLNCLKKSKLKFNSHLRKILDRFYLLFPRKFSE